MKKRNTSRIDLVGTSLVGGSGRSGLCGVFSPLRLRAYRRRDCRAGGDMQGRFLPGAGTGAFVLLSETAENGDASGYPENPAGQMTGCRPIFCSGGFREKRFFRGRSDGNRPVRQRLRRHKKTGYERFICRLFLLSGCRPEGGGNGGRRPPPGCLCPYSGACPDGAQGGFLRTFRKDCRCPLPV